MQQSTIGEYIEKSRKEHGMSQRTLAEIADLTNSTISRIEAGTVTPDPDTLKKIADALGLDKNLLLKKSGHSDLHEGAVLLARKAEGLTKKQQDKVFKLLNETIDEVLDNLD